jgi:hypothetical protein
MSRITLEDWQQVEHVARLAVLAMCARGVAQAEHAEHDEIRRVVITVTNPGESLPSVDLEFYGSGDIPLGGVAV